MEREEKEKQERAARLAILFEADDVFMASNEIDEDVDQEILDLGAAKGGVASYMEKIDTHL